MEENEARLTVDEMKVLEGLGQAYSAFAELPEYHPADQDEFAFHIHAVGRIVLARSAARAHPERGWIKTSA
jgi:hypothetical protein